MKKITWILSLFLSVSTVFGQDQDWLNLEGDGYTIAYPASWRTNQDGTMGTTFMLFSPMRSAKDTFKENINLLIQDIGNTEIDLDEYTKLSEKQVKELLPNSKLIESERVKRAGRTCHKLVYSGTQGAIKLSFIQYYWVIDGKAYILTFTAEQAEFDNYRELGEKIMATFKITV